MKTAAILTIGNEILSGRILNTNSQFLSKLLSQHGYKVVSHLAILDDLEVIKEAAEEIVKQVDIVITTGGLGPTCDDKTKEALLSVFFERGALANSLGTAPGLILQKGEKYLFSLPGVPQEMKQMAEHQLLPFLIEHVREEEAYVEKLYSLAFHNELEIDPFLRSLKGIEVGIYPNYGYLSVSLAARGKSKEEARAKLDKPLVQFEEQFSRYLYAAEDGKLETALCQLFCERGLTLSTAESCTGGLIASTLTKVPGASNYFLGGVVTYSDPQKETLLKVKKETLKKKGAVSKEVVEEMAKGALALFGSDYAIAVSGIAGPGGGTKEKPVGTVWGAIAKKGEQVEGKLLDLKVRKSRELIQIESTNQLLGFLYLKVNHGL